MLEGRRDPASGRARLGASDAAAAVAARRRTCSRGWWRTAAWRARCSARSRRRSAARPTTPPRSSSAGRRRHRRRRRPARRGGCERAVEHSQGARCSHARFHPRAPMLRPPSISSQVRKLLSSIQRRRHPAGAAASAARSADGGGSDAGASAPRSRAAAAAAAAFARLPVWLAFRRARPRIARQRRRRKFWTRCRSYARRSPQPARDGLDHAAIVRAFSGRRPWPRPSRIHTPRTGRSRGSPALRGRRTNLFARHPAWRGRPSRRR